MPDESDLNTLYHPENPAAIRPVAEVQARPAAGSARTVGGFIAEFFSLLLLILGPFSSIWLLPMTMIGVGLGVVGWMAGGNVLREARASAAPESVAITAATCRIVGIVLTVGHVLSIAAWFAAVVFGLPPVFGLP